MLKNAGMAVSCGVCRLLLLLLFLAANTRVGKISIKIVYLLAYYTYVGLYH